MGGSSTDSNRESGHFMEGIPESLHSSYDDETQGDISGGKQPAVELLGKPRELF